MPVADQLGPDIEDVWTGIRNYYTANVRRYGVTPLGVGWRCMPTQQLRFVQLMRLCTGRRFSLDDLGCGYGALLTFLADRHAEAGIDYLGIDVSPVMIRHARRLWRDHLGASFAVGHASPRIADYCVASGIFNIKQEVPTECWERFIADTLASMRNGVRSGFAVNLMAPAVETGIRAVQLYRCPPGRWIRYCEEKLGLTVELIDGYGMREYTLLARKKLK